MTLTTLTTLLDLLIKNTLTITFFILSMMLLLEYINTFTRGSFSNNLRGRKKTQIIFAAILGVLPGCLGTYTIVSLYTHNMIGIGGLLAVLISTIGDEAYYLLAKSPTLWVVLSLILFILAIVFGFIVEYFWGKKKALNGMYEEHFVIHKEENYNLSLNNWKDIKHNITNITFHRAILLFVIVVFMIFVSLAGTGHNHNFMTTNEVVTIAEPIADNHTSHEPTAIEAEHTQEPIHEHNHEVEAAHECTDEHGHFDWFVVTIMVLSFMSLYVIVSVSDHFLQEHLWEHIIKKHFLKVFLWTLFALSLILVINQFLDLHSIIYEHRYIVLLIALLIGLIPESGPHLVFISMFFSGSIPFSILFANSFVQDGHGALPLFAESKAMFFKIKILKLVIAGVLGVVMLYFNF